MFKTRLFVVLLKWLPQIIMMSSSLYFNCINSLSTFMHATFTPWIQDSVGINNVISWVNVFSPPLKKQCRIRLCMINKIEDFMRTSISSHSFLGVTPYFFSQYSLLISRVNGNFGNMSVTLVLPPGSIISVHAWKYYCK